jgi:hypothetical protein
MSLACFVGKARRAASGLARLVPPPNPKNCLLTPFLPQQMAMPKADNSILGREQSVFPPDVCNLAFTSKGL